MWDLPPTAQCPDTSPAHQPQPQGPVCLVGAQRVGCSQPVGPGPPRARSPLVGEPDAQNLHILVYGKDAIAEETR